MQLVKGSEGIEGINGWKASKELKGSRYRRGRARDTREVIQGIEWNVLRAVWLGPQVEIIEELMVKNLHSLRCPHTHTHIRAQQTHAQTLVRTHTVEYARTHARTRTQVALACMNVCALHACTWVAFHPSRRRRLMLCGQSPCMRCSGSAGL